MKYRARKPEESVVAEPAAPTISVTEASRNFADFVNRAYYRRERFILTKGGKPVAELGPTSAGRVLRACDLLGLLASMPRLGPENAASFARDLATARKTVQRRERDPWE